MKKVLVTSADGFMGKNLCAMLDRDEQIEVLRFTDINAPKDLEQYVSMADFIFNFHPELTQSIVDYLTKNSAKTSVVACPSTEDAEEALLKWAEENSTNIYLYRLPQVFGKWSQPHTDSPVAMLCHHITHGQDMIIDNPDDQLTLVYIDDVVDELLRTLNGETKKTPDHVYRVEPEFKATWQEVADKLKEMQEGREKLFVPNFENAFDRNLYATLTSHFTLDQVDYPLDQKRDERGWLVEFIKSQHFGQIYVSRTNPGFTRAIHWHHTKVEKFLVIGGEAEIKLRQLHSDKVETYRVNGDELRVLEMPTGYVHSVKNTGDTDMYLLIWSQQVFDPERPDTYFQEL